MTQPPLPRGFDLPEPSPPTAEQLRELSEIRLEFPAATFLTFAEDIATTITYGKRLAWLKIRRSEHPEEERLAARSIAVRIRAMGLLEWTLEFMRYLYSILPNVLTWVLVRSRSKSSWYPLILICIFCGIGGYLIWNGLILHSIAPFAAVMSLLLILILKEKIPKSKNWDRFIDSSISKIQKNQNRLNAVYDRASKKLEDLLSRTQEHLDQVDWNEYEAKAEADIKKAEAEFLRVLNKYEENPWAVRYMRQGAQIVKKYAAERAATIWSMEQRRVEIGENARAHRWSATILATLIGGYTLTGRAVLVLIIALIPLFYMALRNEPATTEEVEVVKEVAKGTGGLSMLQKLGLLVAAAAILKLFIGWLITFFSRVGMRQLQFKKVFKKATEDRLDSECGELWNEIRLEVLAQEYMSYITHIIDSKGLTALETSMFNRNIENLEKKLDRAKLMFLNHTGKHWLDPDDPRANVGAVLDSGAPEEVADEATRNVFDLLLETI